MSASVAERSPSLTRKIVSALVVAAFVAAIGWFIDWRSAPPPPPNRPQPAMPH